MANIKGNKMNKIPLDLDAIRELCDTKYLHHHVDRSHVLALISEVEALRGIIRQTKKCVECNELMEPLAANPELWNEDIHIVCVGKLRDKLNEALNKLNIK